MDKTKSMRNKSSHTHIGNSHNMKNFNYRPSPNDFMEFFPWACKQYEVDVIVHSITYESKQYSTRKMKSTQEKRKAQSIKSVDPKDKTSSSSSFNFLEDIKSDGSKIEVTAVLDHTHSTLICIKIDNNVKVPRTVFQVIALIVEFYPFLTSLSADRGIDAYCIHEITKILTISSITEVCLDGTYLRNPNYHILLETASNLKCLSLAKCQINDEIIKKIAENIMFPRPSAKTLTFLNISSNRITDTGAAHLANALKINRHLAYLNMADNSITDAGASHIFDIMLEFPILKEDLKESTIRRKEYMAEKNKLFHKYVAELKLTGETKSTKRKGNGKSLVGRRNKKTEEWPMDKVASLKSLIEEKVTTSLDVKFFDKAENIALQEIGPFDDPFENTLVKDGKAYCAGNNTLTCLNLAYNSLSYTSLQKLIKVLIYQKHNQQTPRGLFRVRLEGNYLPSTCEEYTEINELLHLALEATNTKQFKNTKKHTKS